MTGFIFVFVAFVVLVVVFAWAAKMRRGAGRRGEIKIGGPLNQGSQEGPKVGRSPGAD